MVTPLVVGLDLSLTSTGLAIASPDGIQAVTTIQTKGAKSDSWSMRDSRMSDIIGRIHVWILENRKGLIKGFYVEGPSYGSTTGSQHDRSGLWWRAYDAWGGDAQFNIIQPQSRAKYATGAGNASKDKVLAATVKQFLSVDITDNNVADAVQLAAMGARHQGWPIDGEKSKASLESMEKIAS